MAGRLRLQNSDELVGICGVWVCYVADRVDHVKHTNDQGGGGEPGEKFENGIVSGEW